MRTSGLVKEWVSGEYQAHWYYAVLIQILCYQMAIQLLFGV